jgi:hypothetical protein
MTTVLLPNPEDVAGPARGILDAIHTDPEYDRLIDGCGQYEDDWTCMTGTLTVDCWDLTTDALPLLEEALRALALKASIYSITRDEDLAEIPVAKPVDESLHAVLAQRTLTERMADRSGFQIIHMTDVERQAEPYEPGGWTWSAYLEAFGAAPPPRYWIGATEHGRRVAIIAARLDQVGIRNLGHQHDIVFAEPLPAV